MPIETRFDLENNFIRNTYTGKISPAEVLENALQTLQQPEFHPGMHSLSDFSQMKFININFNILHEYNTHMPFIEQTHGPCRWAMVSTNALSFGVLRMFELLNGNSPIEMRVFKTMKEGEVWLQEKPSISSS